MSNRDALVRRVVEPTSGRPIRSGIRALKPIEDEAIELTRKFLAVAGDGEVEIREIYSESDFAPR